MDLTLLFKDLTAQLANWIEVIASLIIAFAVVEATVRAARVFVTPHIPAEAKEDLRLRLGRWLAVALEFELAADILRTAISPTWQEIGLLAAIAAIRTGLNYFLQLEIDRAAARAKATPGSELAMGQPGTNGNTPDGAPGDKRPASSQPHDEEVAGGRHATP